MNREVETKKYAAMMSVVKSAKKETIRTLGGVAKRHKFLKWPIMITLMAFVFLYNCLYYLGLHLHLKDKFAKAFRSCHGHDLRYYEHR